MENVNISKIYKFKLDTKESKPQKLGISVNQFDSVLFRVSIVENKAPKNLTGCAVSVVVAKDNGYIEKQSDNIVIKNEVQGTVDILLNNSLLDTTGACMVQIIIWNENETIRTPKFICVVNEIIDGEIIVEASKRLSIIDELDKKIDILEAKVNEYEHIPNKDYVDQQIANKADINNVYTKNECYNKCEIDNKIDEAIVGGLIDLNSYAKKELVEKELANKVDKVEGMGLSSNDFNTAYKQKLEELTNYIHPNNANVRHVSDAEKLYWNGKADDKAVTSSSDGLMTPALKNKLDGISAHANNYTHPSTHPASIIIQDKNNRFVTDAEKDKWNNLMYTVNDILQRLLELESKI